ncbi:MAG TPA: HAMP domain-containing sensor histidine kinase [Acidimicrobiales bacterium]|nr:HAMP domain-containing sensor histidine kinase [Acidimicrobiales bacterium]
MDIGVATVATSITAELRGAALPTRARLQLDRLRSALTGARTRILGWYVILLAVAIGLSLVAERQVLLHRLSNRVDTQLTVDADALSHQAAGSRSSVTALFDNYLRTHVAAPDEEFLTIVGARPYEASFGGRYRLEQLGGFVSRVAGVADPVRGDLDTPAGPVRYLAVPVVQPGSPPGTFVAAYFTDAVHSEVNSEVSVAAAVSLTMLLLMSIIAWLVAGRVLAPVRLMTETARSIGESDLSRRIPRTTDDEIGRLATTFNSMLDRLQAAFLSQREFVSDAGHELRTPITVIQGHLELLGDDPTERAETMALVRDELDRMSRMVDDLLLLAKAERPGFLRLEPVAVDDLVQELLAKVVPLAPRRWSTRIQGSAVTMADRQRLTQAMMNLVANAVAHTTESDAITLGLDVGRGEYRIWVSDTGSGIPFEDQARIFDRFARGRHERRRSQGAGLGLAIVKAIAEAHRGRVELASSPGDGATFTLALPLQPTIGEGL